MSNNITCHRCGQQFSSPQRLNTHLNRKIPCLEVNQTVVTFDKLMCHFCHKKFVRQYNLDRHLNDSRCRIMKNPDRLGVAVAEFAKQLNEKDREIAELKKKTIVLKKLDISNRELAKRVTNLEKDKSTSNVINNNLNIVCVGNHDNYLDMLTAKWGSFDKALEYIRDCALSQLTGDCKLIGKIYMDENNENQNIHFTDQSKTKITYYNEKNEKVLDTRESFGRRLANNLQNSYLKGVNHLLRSNLDNRGCPNKFLEEYDIQTWNGHIYELSDVKYHKKIINHLNIQQATNK